MTELQNEIFLSSLVGKVSPVIEDILMVLVRLTEGWYMRDVDRTKSGDPGGIEQPDVPMLRTVS
jgi:hypothetical protein